MTCSGRPRSAQTRGGDTATFALEQVKFADCWMSRVADAGEAATPADTISVAAAATARRRMVRNMRPLLSDPAPDAPNCTTGRRAGPRSCVTVDTSLAHSRHGGPRLGAPARTR